MKVLKQIAIGLGIVVLLPAAMIPFAVIAFGIVAPWILFFRFLTQ